jgi:H/ACA ribonucleoprotein complex subunit 4
MEIDLENIKSEKTINELLDFSIINIDKPSGPTSFSVADFVRKKMNVKKTGHLGTLDPMVTGVLPVALGRACRLSNYMMQKDKEYVGVMRIHSEISEDNLKKEVKNFIGKIIQLPPVRSRVKRAERTREIKRFEILEKEDKDVLFIADVEAGTYIRKLIHDLGEKIGGAHMLELRRTKAGLFTEDKSHTLYDLEKAVEELKKGDESQIRKMLIPGEIISQLLMSVDVKEEFMKKLFTGSPLFFSFLEKKIDAQKDEKICLFCKDRFVGCYKVVNKADIFAMPEFVFN